MMEYQPTPFHQVEKYNDSWKNESCRSKKSMKLSNSTFGFHVLGAKWVIRWRFSLFEPIRDLYISANNEDPTMKKGHLMVKSI
jgi:hypothetical protein